jgi:hypothetical protein
MPDDRLFHKCLGHSVKVNALSDFEDIVWRTYIQAADDFGVMRFLALPIQDFYDRFQKRGRQVQAALERIASLKLIHTFIYQDRTYCYQETWQKYQKIEYPRTTIHPKPPAAALAECCPLTQYLFSFHPGGVRVPSKKGGGNSGNTPGRFPEDSGKVPGELPELSGTSHARSHAPARTLTARTNGSRLTEGDARGSALELQPSEAGEALADRAGRFCERYAELYTEHRHGARYHNKPSLDFVEALGLVETWDDARLEQLAVAFLTTDEAFCRNGSGTIAQFRSRASWCDTKLREAGL